MNRRETPPGAPHPPIRSGLAEVSILDAGRSDPPVKPTSEVAHQPGQQPAAAIWLIPPARPGCLICHQDHSVTPETHPELTWPAAARPCGGVQRGETKSAGQTTGGARGGSRLGNPCDEDGLTR